MYDYINNIKGVKKLTQILTTLILIFSLNFYMLNINNLNLNINLLNININI